MNKSFFAATTIVAALAFASTGSAQQLLLSTNTTTDTIAAYNAVDGSLVDPAFFPIADAGGNKVAAIQVFNEIWVSEQIGDRIVRYDQCGTELGVIGPTFAGGGLDNIRGMTLIGGTVYVCNDGGNNGATAASLVTFDTLGNHLATLPLSSSSPFSLILWQGDILVASDAAGDDVHRYTLGGTSVGTFHDSTGLNFAHQISPASDGNVWCAGFSTNNVVKLDMTTGAILSSFAASGARGVHELQNGNVMWTNGSGAWVYDVLSMTSTSVGSGSHNHLNTFTADYACNRPYGAGCHDFVKDNSNLFMHFPDVASGKAALDGNALQFSLTPDGYVANWLPGVAAALYVPPTAGATIVADASTTTETFTPSVAIPVPGGTTVDWTISSEGILTAGPVGNEGTDTTPSLADPDTEAGLAFYTWFSQNPTESGSGKIKWEEISGVLYVTFDGVETFGSPTTAPSTYQWQIDMTSGEVIMLWPSISISNTTGDMLVGCTLAGTGLEPISQVLPVVTPYVLKPDEVQSAMTLSATPRPVINPSTAVTYTADNAPEFFPGSGVHVGTMFLSVNELPGGFDLTGILTTMAGCNAYIATLDLDLGASISATPTLSWTFTYDNVIFAPGNRISAQAVALFDPSTPLLNGEAGGFVLSNGVRSEIFTQ